MFLTGCSRSLIEPVEAYMINKATPPEDEAMVKNWVQRLREGKFGEIERDLDPSLQSDDLPEKLTSMARLLPAQQPTSAKVIGYGVVDDADSSSTITTTLEYEFPHEWLLATLVKQDHAGTIMVTGFDIDPIPDSVENHNRFTLIGKDSEQYVVLFLALAALGISLYAFIACLRTKMGKWKWLWAILCFVGLGRLAVNWTTGATGFTAICIGVPPVGAAMVPLYSPWMVYTSLPVGAVLFLIFRELVVGRPVGPVKADHQIPDH
jgi:hypothetical protein